LARIGRDRLKVTASQYRAIAALLSAKSVTEAAGLAGVGERTLRRWLTQHHFITALRQAEGAMLDSVTRRLLAMQSDALDAVQGILENHEIDENTRLRAAMGILGHVLKLRETRDIEERISALEKVYDKKI
jgi:hypothetical protein